MLLEKKSNREKPTPTPNNVSYLHMLTLQYKVKEKNKRTANRYKVFYPKLSVHAMDGRIQITLFPM